jgi:hypothetical protein
LGGIFEIWEGMIYYLPIWNVLVCEREQGQVGEHWSMGLRSLACQIRQLSRLGKQCQLGFPRFKIAAGLIGLAFSPLKKCIIVATAYLYTIQPFRCARRGGNGWMAMDIFG